MHMPLAPRTLRALSRPPDATSTRTRTHCATAAFAHSITSWQGRARKTGGRLRVWRRVAKPAGFRPRRPRDADRQPGAHAVAAGSNRKHRASNPLHTATETATACNRIQLRAQRSREATRPGCAPPIDAAPLLRDWGEARCLNTLSMQKGAGHNRRCARKRNAMAIIAPKRWRPCVRGRGCTHRERKRTAAAAQP